jgi:hypothetical protein
MTETPDPARRETYLRGVDALLDGRWEDALADLESGADAGHAEAALAAAKAHLRRGQGSEARRRLGPLLDAPPSDPGHHAYLVLLLASAVALEGRAEDATGLLDEVPRLDPRMEHAARALRRRIEKGRPVDLRF